MFVHVSSRFNRKLWGRASRAYFQAVDCQNISRTELGTRLVLYRIMKTFDVKLAISMWKKIRHASHWAKIMLDQVRGSNDWHVPPAYSELDLSSPSVVTNEHVECFLWYPIVHIQTTSFRLIDSIILSVRRFNSINLVNVKLGHSSCIYTRESKMFSPVFFYAVSRQDISWHWK